MMGRVGIGRARVAHLDGKSMPHLRFNVWSRLLREYTPRIDASQLSGRCAAVVGDATCETTVPRSVRN
jgi:hypothetical protein